MPIYAYKCTECNHQIEELQKVSDPPKVDCPQCGRPALVKQVTAAGFQLKGSGWYVTDFREKPAKKAAGAADKAGATDAASGAESKPADSTTGGETKSAATDAKKSESTPSPTPPPASSAD